MFQAWVASGIFPAFSNGNAGPGCSSAGVPGAYVDSYAAGAYDINNVIADFSSRGPSGFDGGMKPNISAPGVNVRSSVPGNGYDVFSGTSMASPHVAGTVALCIASGACAGLSPAQIIQKLRSDARAYNTANPAYRGTRECISISTIHRWARCAGT